MTEWNLKKRPVCLEKRFEFQSYEDTRNFLDLLGKCSEEENKFPDISFGKTYVNITLRPEDESLNSEISDDVYNFAEMIDKIYL